MTLLHIQRCFDYCNSLLISLVLLLLSTAHYDISLCPVPSAHSPVTVTSSIPESNPIWSPVVFRRHLLISSFFFIEADMASLVNKMKKAPYLGGCQIRPSGGDDHYASSLRMGCYRLYREKKLETHHSPKTSNLCWSYPFVLKKLLPASKIRGCYENTWRSWKEPSLGVDVSFCTTEVWNPGAMSWSFFTWGEKADLAPKLREHCHARYCDSKWGSFGRATKRTCRLWVRGAFHWIWNGHWFWQFE